MAAMRSASLVILGRRACASSGSSAASSMARGRGLVVHQLFGTSASSLRGPSARNFESLHRFSTSGMKCTDQKKPFLMKRKDGNVLRWWWQSSSVHVKNYRSTSYGDQSYVKKYRYIRVSGTIIWLASFCYMVVIFQAINNMSNKIRNGTNSKTSLHFASSTKFPYFMLPCYRLLDPVPLSCNATSKRSRPRTK